MTLALTSAAADAAAFPPVVPVPAAEVAAFGAALRLLTHLERGERIDATALRGAMEAAFGASDATGAWTWKTAYDACEAATVLFLRKYGKALFRKAASPAARLSASRKSRASCQRTRAALRKVRRCSNSQRRRRLGSRP